MTDKPPDDKSKNPPSVEDGTGSQPHIQRRSQWRSSLDALSYISHLSHQPELKIRDTDRITGLAVVLASFATVLCLVLHKLSGVSLQITLLCDLFLGVSLTIYVFNRLGILTGMKPRQAVLAWQLIRTFCFVGVFITINLALLITLALAWVSLSTIKPPQFH